MAENSKIEWTESTWNPVTGCGKISLKAKRNGAKKVCKNLAGMGFKNSVNIFIF